MNKNCLRNLILVGAAGLVLINTAQAGTPVWTFAQVSGYPSSVTVSTTGTATIKYTVTNQSHKSHTLGIKPIQGIMSSGCTSPLVYHQSCTLTLLVNGSGLKGDVLGGPVLCNQYNPNQCYQPSQANSLNIRLTQAPPVQQYTVTSSAGTNGSVSPSGAQTVNSGATLTFTATPDTGYGVNQWLVDGTLAQTGGTTYQLANITTNHTVNVSFGTVTLNPSVSTLALSINCQLSSSCTTIQNAALTGNPRQISIQNTGSVSATNVSVNASALPSGTTITSNTCSTTLNAGDSCIITLTPGSIASSDSNNTACTSGTQPIASTVMVTADGGLSSQVNTYVLGYGCQYQGGFLYSVDDSYTDYPATGSIGGKVASLVDQAEPSINSVAQATSIIWSSNGSGGTSSNVSYDVIPLITEITTANSAYSTAQTAFNSTYSNTGTFPFPASSAFFICNGASEGQCNTYNILVLYNTYKTNFGIGGSPYSLSAGPTSLTEYAAGACKVTINTYSDWYLPAICEMDAVNTNVTCPSGMQSMLGSLSFLLGDPNATTPSTSCVPPIGTNCLAGDYWGSTEFAGLPKDYAWFESFNTGGSSQDYFAKYGLYGVRCSRDLSL